VRDAVLILTDIPIFHRGRESAVEPAVVLLSRSVGCFLEEAGLVEVAVVVAVVVIVVVAVVVVDAAKRLPTDAARAVGGL
jgi:hypothetical protein